jgi:hypothetical protein
MIVLFSGIPSDVSQSLGGISLENDFKKVLNRGRTKTFKHRHDETP